ncbi:unnamed protein product [Camellia sinensis]
MKRRLSEQCEASGLQPRSILERKSARSSEETQNIQLAHSSEGKLTRAKKHNLQVKRDADARSSAIVLAPAKRHKLKARSVQKVASMTVPVLENAVETLLSKDIHLLQALNAADLGCAAGPATFTVISTIKRMMEKKCRELNCQTLELQVYLNDLPGNDFNTLFKGLSSKVVGNKCEEVSCYVMGVPVSFHGRLFPRNSLHLVHSCFSGHWLTQAPKGLTSREGLALNKGKIYISKTSPPVVVPNGCMVLILRGRLSSNPLDMESCFTWELLAITIAELVSQFAKVARAFTEPIISNQFEHEIMDKLYDKFTHIVVSDLEAKIPKTTSCFSMGRPDLKRKLHLVKWKEWWWRFANEDEALWKKVVCSKYNLNGGVWFPTLNQGKRASKLWSDILAAVEHRPMMFNFYTINVQIRVGNGNGVRSFVEKQDSTGGWEISFRRNLFVWEKEELNKLSEELCLAPSLNGNDEDKPVLLAAQSGQCIVSTLYKYIDLEAGEQSIVSKLVWVNYLPPKVQLFGWLAWKHKVKPSDFLQRIGILDGSVSYQCAFCNNELETVQHW